MSAPAGTVIVYRCPRCGKDAITVLVDEGVTPMFLACRATPKCVGTSQSSIVLAPADVSGLADLVSGNTTPTQEWFLPSLKWARRKGMEVLSHVKQGGLMLRPVKAVKK